MCINIIYLMVLQALYNPPMCCVLAGHILYGISLYCVHLIVDTLEIETTLITVFLHNIKLQVCKRSQHRLHSKLTTMEVHYMYMALVNCANHWPTAALSFSTGC